MHEYKEIPCKCGFTYEINKDKFEVYHLNMGTVFGVEIPKKLVPRCKNCLTISVIERINDE